MHLRSGSAQHSCMLEVLRQQSGVLCLELQLLSTNFTSNAREHLCSRITVTSQPTTLLVHDTMAISTMAEKAGISVVTMH